MSDVALKVKAIIAEQLGVKDESVTDTAKIMDDLGADSLDIVELFVILEENFDIRIPEEEAKKLVTVEEAIKYIEENLS